MSPFFKSLSFRLLILTVFFVMLSEVFIYTPSVARFRLSFLEERLAAAHLAVLAIQATPDGMVTEELADRLLDHVGAFEIVAIKDEAPSLMLTSGEMPEINKVYDLRQAGFFQLVGDAFEVLVQTQNRVLKVIGPSPKDPETLIVIEINEMPMRDEMIGFSWRILNLSLLISAFTALAVFASLQWLLVGPMRRITMNMIAFRRRPEDRSNDLIVDERSDEIGIAQRELATMKRRLRAALRQQARLAALGTAVNKINHDLRNMLSTATLISDRLAESDDPQVKKVAPILIGSIDRAANLCADSLNFTQDTPPLNLEEFSFDDLVEDVRLIVEAGEGAAFSLNINQGGNSVILADRDQIFRAFSNLVRNAVNAGADQVTINVEPVSGHLRIEIIDNGPGIPVEALDKLFVPFQYSTSEGGSGLGLAIARDILRAHGGSLSLGETSSTGTIFIAELPLRASH